MQSALRRTMLGFARNPAQSAHVLRQLYQSNPGAFVAESRNIIREDIGAPGLQYVLTLLLSDGILLKWLCDQNVFTLDQATRIVTVVRKVDPRIDFRLISAVSSNTNTGSDAPLDERSALRVLELTSGPSIHARFLPIVAQLLRHSSAKVRSKAALIVGRGNRNAKWVQRQLSEPDPRIRANAVEALWGLDSEDAKAVFYLGLSDTNNRVVGNAVLGLYKIGDPSSIPFLLKMAARPEVSYRETAVWAMEKTGDPRFAQTLADMIGHPSKLRARNLRACAALKRRSDVRAHSLRIMVGAFEHDSTASSATLKIAVLSKSGSVRGLLPTQFALWRDTILVDEYQVDTAGTQSGAAAVAVVVPWSLNPRTQETVFKALCQALSYRRSLDVWTVLKYRGGQASAAAGPSNLSQVVTPTLGLEIGTAQEPKAESSPAAGDSGGAFAHRIAFSTIDDHIQNMLLETGTHESSAPSVHDALMAAVRAFPPNRHMKVILLLLDDSAAALSAAEADALASLAQKGNVLIHSVALLTSEFGRKLAENTGGTHVDACPLEQLVGALERASALLVDGYQVSFPCEAIPSSVKVQVFTSDAKGEADFRPAALGGNNQIT